MKRIQTVKNHFLRNRKKYLLGSILILVITLCGSIGFLVFKSNKYTSRIDVSSNGKIAEPTVKLVNSPLTGLEVNKKLAERPVTGLMIENSPQARPQAGLIDAGVVFEAIAEGGITRFLALYQEHLPAVIGPVRSLRPYYLDWSMGFNAGVAHVGGSEEALQQARTVAGFRDLDQFVNGNSFYRTKDRFAPHNVYTGIDLLDPLNAAKGYKTSTYDALPRKKASPSETPTAATITVNYSSNTFKVEYSYDATSNSYLRSIAGAKHVDQINGEQLSPEVVVVMKHTFSTKSSGHSVYGTLTGGESVVFQDGTATPGRWSKNSRTEQIKLVNGAGEEIKLNPGQTWFHAIPNTKTVVY